MDKTMDTAKPTINRPLMTGKSGPTFRVLENYWQELKGARTLPFRSEVNPARIDDALPHAFILQRVSTSMGRVRVGGQQLNNLLGMDPRGMPLTTFFTPAGRMVVAEYLRRVFEDPAIVELPLFSPRTMGRPRLSGRMILLPMNGSDGQVSMAMGAIVTDGLTGRSPRRFEIPAEGFIRCDHVNDLKSVSPLAETPSMNVIHGGRSRFQAKGPSAERPALRLIVNNG
ncbi:PAS domain-containing protein [Aestuariibius sp. HNIBRBA575]|uniref:PAS domain-containing protein n=1 Tax=Aestuariibius sp. HNIBRBA575 TaxID=3233343 RepID=UPI0034A23365